MREIRTLRANGRGLETEMTDGSSGTLTRKGRNSQGSQDLSIHRASSRPYRSASCSANKTTGTFGTGGESAAATTTATTGTNGTGGDGEGGGFLAGATGSTGTDGSGGQAACAQAKLIPLNIFVAVDQSGSMIDSNKWDNVKSAFTTFFQDPNASGIGVALRFWPDPLDFSNPSPPIACNDDADFSCGPAVVAACETPEVDVGPLSDPLHVQKLVDTFNAHSPNGSTPTSAALDGATKWAAKYVFAHNHTEQAIVLLVTDGEPTTCNTDPVAINTIASKALSGAGVLAFRRRPRWLQSDDDGWNRLRRRDGSSLHDRQRERGAAAPRRAHADPGQRRGLLVRHADPAEPEGRDRYHPGRRELHAERRRREDEVPPGRERFVMHRGGRLVLRRALEAEGLERLLRYGARPPFSLERISILPDGRIAYLLRKPRRNGATHLVLDPLHFFARIASLIPPPRYPLVRLAGVFAPHSSWRAAVVPKASGPRAPTNAVKKKAKKKPGEASAILATVPGDASDDPAPGGARTSLGAGIAKPVGARIDWASHPGAPRPARRAAADRAGTKPQLVSCLTTPDFAHFAPRARASARSCASGAPGPRISRPDRPAWLISSGRAGRPACRAPGNGRCPAYPLDE